MTSFGSRLKTERQRLGLTQVELADAGDVSKNTQLAYEADDNSPTAKYLMAVAEKGVDLQYLFSGEYSSSGVSRQVAELLKVLNQLEPTQQAMAFAMLNLFLVSPKAGQAPVEQADEIWRAARLFQKFLRMSTKGKEMVELAAEIEP